MATDRGGLPAVLVEAFGSSAGTGNGAAVVLLAEPCTDGWMQAIARSLSQSETAFLLQAPQGWLLRWFTPSCEVNLCGHATLAALLALSHWQRLPAGAATTFHSRSGPLEVALDPVRAGWGALLLPSPGLLPQAAPASLLRLLQRHQLGDLQGFWSSSLGYTVALLAASADLGAMACPAAELDGELANGLVLMQPLVAACSGDAPAGARSTGLAGAGTAGGAVLEGEAADYQLRFFAPALGIAEDPVTGSAHALVAPWWQERLGRSRVVGWQCSDRPGGMVCEAASSGMIRLLGSGHLLWDGILHAGCEMSAAPAFADCGSDASPSEDLWSAWLRATRCG